MEKINFHIHVFVKKIPRRWLKRILARCLSSSVYLMMIINNMNTEKQECVHLIYIVF
jgi:hypothetical protein